VIERTAEQLERAGAGRGALRSPAGPDA
jgi:hypothetical protein